MGHFESFKRQELSLLKNELKKLTQKRKHSCKQNFPKHRTCIMLSRKIPQHFNYFHHIFFEKFKIDPDVTKSYPKSLLKGITMQIRKPWIWQEWPSLTCNIQFIADINYRVRLQSYDTSEISTPHHSQSNCCGTCSIMQKQLSGDVL